MCKSRAGTSSSEPQTKGGRLYEAASPLIFFRAFVGFLHHIAPSAQRFSDAGKRGRRTVEWIVDNTREESRPYTCIDIADALQDAADTFRKRLWTDDDPCVQIWLEKDALAGVIAQVTP